MAYKLIWSPSARLDLKDIAAFIAEDDSAAAQRFVKSILLRWQGFGTLQEEYQTFTSVTGCYKLTLL